MRAALTVAYHELRVTFHRRSFLAVTALLPLSGLAALLALQVFSGRHAAPELARVGYVDAVGIFKDHGTQGNTLFVPYATMDAGLNALLDEQVSRLYLIPPDYIATGRVQRYAVGQGLDFFAGGRDPDPELRSFLIGNLAGDALTNDVVARLRDPLRLAAVTLDAHGKPRGFDEGRFLFFQGMAILLLVSLFMSSGFLLQGVGEEKENRIMEVLLSSVTAGQLLVGKILGLGAAGLAQIVIWLASAVLLLRLFTASIPNWPVSAPGALTLIGILFFVLGFLLFATLMAGLGAVATTSREGQQISGIFVVPVIAAFYATPYVASHPTGSVARFLTLFPLTSPVVVFERLGVSSISAWEVAASAAVLGLTVAGTMLLVVRVFRAYLLMYGKRPGARDLWETLTRG